MPRHRRIVFPGHFYHITQRGNNKQRVFHDKNDNILYLKKIEECRAEFGMDIFAYCLMPNHVHFIVRPRTVTALADVYRRVNLTFTKYYQKKYDYCGHVWQGRFYSCLLDPSHARQAVRYVLRNPVRAGLSRTPWSYAWSSAKTLLGVTYRWITVQDAREVLKIHHWRKYVEAPDDIQFKKSLEHMTQRNLVLGSEDFVEEMEERCGESLKVKAMGRPRKSGDADTF